MREGPDVLINALAGERVVFRTHAADTGGELIQFDLVLTKVGGSPPATFTSTRARDSRSVPERSR
jgi:hypothetical protein